MKLFKINHATLIAAVLILFFCGCTSTTLTPDTTSSPNNPSTENSDNTSGENTGATENADNVSVKLYSACPGPDCVEVEAYVPPKEDWCKSGFRLCAKTK